MFKKSLIAAAMMTAATVVSPAVASAQATNQAPVANDDTFDAVGTDDRLPRVLPIGSNGLLANDVDPDGDSLSIEIVDQPANGRILVLLRSGGFSYVADQGFEGVDTFTYRISDGELSDTATATINVIVQDPQPPTNRAPSAINDSFEAVEGATLVVDAPGVLANDTDADPITARLVTPTANGSVALNADGSFSYTPNAGFVGTDSFRYVATDGQLDSVVATATIDVAAAPLPSRLVIGSNGNDRLVGTEADEVFVSGSGRRDTSIGNGGSDTFVFGNETANFRRETDIITDFGADDVIGLQEGASIARSFVNRRGDTVLILDGRDRDRVVLRGFRGNPTVESVDI